MSDGFLSAERILATTFVSHVEIHHTLGSTNDRAKELAQRTSIELPALVVARHQTAGRGRGQNSWWSADGALTFSLLLEPNTIEISTAKWPQLSLTAAVAVCDALSAELNQIVIGDRLWPSGLSIKWPNDVMLEGKKVCGILIESPGGAAPAKNRLVIGIGINVNNRVDQLAISPPDGNAIHSKHAVALCEVTNRPHDLQKLLESVLQSLEARISELALQNPNLSMAWQRLDWLAQRRVAAQVDGHWVEGFCPGIDLDGSLLFESISGKHRLYSGSVRVL